MGTGKQGHDSIDRDDSFGRIVGVDKWELARCSRIPVTIGARVQWWATRLATGAIIGAVVGSFALNWQQIEKMTVQEAVMQQQSEWIESQREEIRELTDEVRKSKQ